MSSLTLSIDAAIVANHTPTITNHNSRGSPNFCERGRGKGRYRERGGQSWQENSQ